MVRLKKTSRRKWMANYVLIGLFQQMIVEEGSTSYEMWESLPIPMYMKLFYFNITNAEDLTARVPGTQL